MKRNSNTTFEFTLAPNAKWVHEGAAQVKIILLSVHSDSVVQSQLIENDKKLFTVSNDNTAYIWEFPTCYQLKSYSNLHKSSISCAKVSNDNTKFITSSWDKTVKCWDIETGNNLWIAEHDYMVTYCDISFDDKIVMSVSDIDFLIFMWDLKTGNIIKKIDNLHYSTITSCKFLPSNDRIITTSMDKTCIIYDLIVNKPTITLSGHTGVVSNSSFTSDERMIVTGSWDKTLQIYDIATGAYRKNGPFILSKGHEGSVSCCAISKDGQLCVSGGYDGRLVLWEMVAEEITITPKLILRGHTGWVNSVAITSDNKRIVTSGKDREIRIWNIENSDNIKLVIERNKHIGNKVINCSQCLRTFAVTKLLKRDTKIFCVFCRLQESNKRPSLFDPSEQSIMNSFRNRRESLINQIDPSLINVLRTRRDSIEQQNERSINIIRNRKESLIDQIDQNAIAMLRTRKESIFKPESD